MGGSGRVRGPAVAAGKFSAYGFPSLGPGAGKVPVGACVLTRVLYACGGEMSRDLSLHLTSMHTLSLTHVLQPELKCYVF